MKTFWRMTCCSVILLYAAAHAGAGPLEDLLALPDNRVAVRTSMGVRSARAITPRQIEVVIGMSVTRAAETASAWRLVSFQDPSYAYEKFVTPVSAVVRHAPEVNAPAGCLFPRFERIVVTLDVPEPLKDGAEYHIIAQGVNGEMVTGTHTAAID